MMDDQRTNEIPLIEQVFEDLEEVKDEAGGPAVSAIRQKSEVVAPLVRLGAQIARPIVRTGAHFASPGAFVGARLSRPIVRAHKFVKAPFVALAGRVTRPFRNLVRPIAESIGEAIDTALEPVTTAASPLS